jgi:hypothetical protein
VFGFVKRNLSGAKRFGDAGYFREELVAELWAAFLRADLDTTPEIRADHADDIGHFQKCLREDKRAIFSAAATRSAPPIISTGSSKKLELPSPHDAGMNAADILEKRGVSVLSAGYRCACSTDH